MLENDDGVTVFYVFNECAPFHHRDFLVALPALVFSDPLHVSVVFTSGDLTSTRREQPRNLHPASISVHK